MQQHPQLIKDCLKGKKDAQYGLYNLYAPTMMGICYRYTKSVEDAEDVLQDGFIRVFTKLQQYKQDGDLSAWIRRIMVNCAISYLQKHNRYKKDLHLDDVAVHPISDENPEVKIDTKELIEIIRALPTNYQTIFNLIAIEGFNHIEVSELLHTNVNTIRSQYSRARAMLINILKKTDLENQVTYYGG